MWVLFYPHGTELIFKTHSLCPHPRKRVQTSSRPSISNKYRKDLSWAELWGSGAGPTSISSSCWWPGAEGKLSIQYCIQLFGHSGEGVGWWGGVASFTENYFCASLCAPSPLLPSCFWHGLDPGRHRPRLPLAHLPRGEQLWSGTTSLVWLKEKEKPAWPSSPLFTLPTGSNTGRLCNGQAFL